MRPLREKALGKHVRKARRDLGLTQDELAERLNMEESTVRAIEAGRRGVSTATLMNLAAKLQTTAGVLLGEKREHLKPVEAEAAKLVGDLEGAWQHSALKILREIHDQVVASARRRSK